MRDEKKWGAWGGMGRRTGEAVGGEAMGGGVKKRAEEEMERVGKAEEG